MKRLLILALFAASQAFGANTTLTTKNTATKDAGTITFNSGTISLSANDLAAGIVACARMPSLTGDISMGLGTCSTTLATVNSNVGTFGSATKASVFTVNAKGLITAASESTVTPAIGSITGLGTGVATALAVNVGSAGAPVVLNGAGGTPSSLTLTNATGLPVGSLTGLGTGVGTWLATPTGANLTSALSSGGGTSNFLRADGTFAAPAGAVASVSNSDSTLTVSPTTGAVVASLNLAHANSWTKAQSVATVTLTDATNISTDASGSNNFKVTLAGNRTLDNPTNLVNGTVYNWLVIQDSGGSKTLAYGNKFKFAGGAKTISTAANAVDLISCVYESVTDLLYCVLAKAFS